MTPISNSACLAGLNSDQVKEVAIAPITSLPDESFCDIATIFIRNVDDVYFNDRGINRTQAVDIRAQLARRMMASGVWLRHSRDRSERIETHLGPAAATFFFNEYSTLQPAKCYLLPKGIDRLDPFLRTVKVLAESGTFLFVAIVLLNLLEVSPRTAQLPVIVAAAKAWLTAQPNDHSFWMDSDIGRRLCSVIDAIVRLDTTACDADQSLRGEIDSLLAALVRLGVSDAHHLEEALRSR
jgi:hypothetical protein